MYSGQISWTGIDPGQEGLLEPQSWLKVLQILQKHEGESHRDLSSPLFRDLQIFKPNKAWKGSDGNRSFFRDYGKSWKDLGALDKEQINHTGIIRLTTLGHDIANGVTPLPEFFRSVIDDYRLESIRVISTNTKLSINPFWAISYAIIETDPEDITELQRRVESIMLQSYPEISTCTFQENTTSARRFRTFIRLLINAEALSVTGNHVTVTDYDYITELTAGASILSTDSNQDGVEESLANVENMTEDERKRKTAQRVVREGQKKFRDDLLKAYNSRCAITGANEESVLEAAHIMDYKGRKTNTVKNGILLAVDIHRLFDANLLGINPTTLKVELSKKLLDRRYRPLDGAALHQPFQLNSGPNLDYLHEKYANFKAQ